MPERSRLRRGDITIREMMELSYSVYRSQVDNKKPRELMDVVDARTKFINNMERQSDGTWKQTGRNVKIVFTVKTIPISYKKNDDIPVHIFPVT